MAKIPVEPWSTEPSAVDATSWTFRQMGCVGIVKEGDAYFIDTGSAGEGFIRFAAERQGYVKRVLPAPESTKETTR
jgi:hypothetical protein